MSRRPNMSPSRPQGSTNANGAKSIPARLARCKKWNLSPWPRAMGNKKSVRQGFPNTSHRGHR